MEVVLYGLQMRMLAVGRTPGADAMNSMQVGGGEVDCMQMVMGVSCWWCSGGGAGGNGICRCMQMRFGYAKGMNWMQRAAAVVRGMDMMQSVMFSSFIASPAIANWIETQVS
ncbi:hypothetical protein C5167_019477 [Papaver somniferum]|uniref:Uncharacterized protein n=1 Tax=Papaver somniferum TaxID=3469 RepID=A0A4Y7ISE2_PAPSO|nr:hypothetical protein C5167_019477 [Papaver somniferum]